jgi:hypothetical protein
MHVPLRPNTSFLEARRISLLQCSVARMSERAQRQSLADRKDRPSPQAQLFHNRQRFAIQKGFSHRVSAVNRDRPTPPLIDRPAAANITPRRCRMAEEVRERLWESVHLHSGDNELWELALATRGVILPTQEIVPAAELSARVICQFGVRIQHMKVC